MFWNTFATDFVNNHETHRTVANIIFCMADPKGAELKKAAAAVIISLRKLDEHKLSEMVARVPNTLKDLASQAMRMGLQDSATGATGGDFRCASRSHAEPVASIQERREQGEDRQADTRHPEPVAPVPKGSERRARQAGGRREERSRAEPVAQAGERAS